MGYLDFNMFLISFKLICYYFFKNILFILLFIYQIINKIIFFTKMIYFYFLFQHDYTYITNNQIFVYSFFLSLENRFLL